jgi:arylformamidase
LGYVDLTRLITEDMQVYPGTEQPKMEKIDIDGYRETLLHMYSHTGTHMDAPYHVFKDKKKLDEMSVDSFIGKAAVVNIPAGAKSIEKSMLSDLDDVEFVLFNTGWASKWGSDDYFYNFPVLTFEAAEYLASLGLKGVGLDAISVDEVNVVELPVHRVLLSAGMVIVENLSNLSSLPPRVLFFAMPLNYKDADGSPIRAFAEVEAL